MTATTAPSQPSAPSPPGPPTSGAALSVLVADKFEASGLDAARGLGCRIEFDPDLTADRLAEAIGRVNPEILIVRSTKVREVALDAGRRLTLVIRAGAGYDNIDVAAASARGIFVANCPGRNAIAVAELAWGLILACDRRLPDQTRDLREGIWDKKGYAKARGLYGRTLGIVGLGRIGLAVAERARAFGMKTIAWSRSLTPARAEALGVEHCASPLDLAARADVVSVHVAATAETKHLVNAEFCRALKDGAYVINTSRGSVVDEEALARAVHEKGVRAGLDVYANQPAPGDRTIANAIVREPGVYGTHHSGASTDQAQEAIAAETLRIIESFMRSGTVPNCVNRAAASPATCLLTVRHRNRPGVLAHVFQIVSTGGNNVEEMENIIYEGAAAACARIRLDTTPTPDQIDSIRGHEHILGVEVTAVGA